MTKVSTDEEREKFKHVEVGSFGPMNDVSREHHFRGIKNAAIARAKRESAGHKDCRCWACLYMDRLSREP